MSSSQSVANCTKCGIRHPRPVGVRCRRNLNSSAPVADPGNDSLHVEFQTLPGPSQAGTSTPPQTRAANTSAMDSKLDLILKKMEQLEAKNAELELKFQQPKHKSAASLTHSSPKRSHKCSSACSSDHRKRSRTQGVSHSALSDTSDEHIDGNSLGNTFDQPSQLGASASSNSQVSVDFLKTNEKVQRQVQRQLQKLQGQQRRGTEGKHSIKSGLHRAGDNAVKQFISWPHHYCFPSAGGQLPEYKELSPLQFMIGFLGCLQDESSNTVKSNMIEYGRHLFQDALETNWATAKHAHMILLQEIERGKCSWRSPDLVEKIRIRNTARVIAQKPVSTQPKSFKSSKDKLCPDYNSNSCRFSSDHVVDGVIHKHACSYCHQEVGRWFSHKIHDCMRRKATESNKDIKKAN